MDKGTFMDPTVAQSYGLIDKVLDHTSDEIMYATRSKDT